MASEILEELRRFSDAVVDRAGFERLFRVRRRAIQSAATVSAATQTGKTFLIDCG
jgi:hypothetical protein